MDARETAGKQTAILTGGSRGLGRALSRALVARGWVVVVDGRDAAALSAAGAETGTVAVPGDVTDPAHRAALVETARRRSGRIDLVVNNASDLGPSPLPRVADVDAPALRHLYEHNVVAPLALLQLALPLLRASGGSALNVTSDAAVEAYPGWGGYGSSKAALEQLSRVLAAEEPGLRVWWVDPGDMRTDMHQRAFPGEDIGDRPLPESVVPALLHLVEARPPSGRIRAAALLPAAGEAVR